MQTNDSTPVIENTTTTTYNGWSNYATWRINLEICDDLCASMNGEQTFPDVYTLAEYLQEEAEFAVLGDEEPQIPLMRDYAAAFLSNVNWYEIAQSNADELIAPDDESSGDL